MAGIAVVDRVQDEFNAGGDAELFEDAVEILLDCVFAKVEFAGNLAVAESFGDQGHDLLLARCEKVATGSIEHTKRRNFRNEVDDVVEVLGTGPDLSVGHAEQTFAEKAQVGVSDG